MGKIHDALQRAEEERAQRGGPPVGPTAPDLLEERSGSGQGLEGALRAGRRSRIVTAGSSAVAEEYRTLRARIQSIRRRRPLRTLVVTSARPGEGKTTTAVNLALSFGLDLGTNTCLIDADLRTPSVHRAFPQLPDAGLAEVLETDVKVDDALLQIPDTRLWVLPVKAMPSQPAELLGSRPMGELLEELSARFDTVIIDAPPVLGLPDAVTLVDQADAALLVVGAGEVARGDVMSALERLDRSKVIGSIFNRCESAQNQAYAGYYGRAD